MRIPDREGKKHLLPNKNNTGTKEREKALFCAG